MGAGLVIAAVGTRLIFLPVLMYNQMTGIKMKLLQPDIDEFQAAGKSYMEQGNKEAAQLERQKIKDIRAKNGIYPIIQLLNIGQLPMHLTWISLVNTISYNYDKYPGMLSEGFLWFKDLSSPDPTGILPVIGAGFIFLNILSSSTSNLNPTMRTLRRYFFLMPLISIPIWMTFPSAFNIYWITTSLIQFAVLNVFRNLKFREFMGIPQYLPDTKLERLNKKVQVEVIKPQLVSSRAPAKQTQKRAAAPKKKSIIQKELSEKEIK